MRGRPTRRELVGAIDDLHVIVQLLLARYNNDRDASRADNIQRLAKSGDAIARPILDAFPPSYGVRRFNPTEPRT